MGGHPECVGGRFPVEVGLGCNVPTQAFRIRLPINGWLVRVWQGERRWCSADQEKAPGRSLAPVDVRVLDASRWYYSSGRVGSTPALRDKNTPTLRVITLREGRALPRYESFLEKGESPLSTSLSSRRKNISTLRVTPLLPLY